jgi:hypothetical protein
MSEAPHIVPVLPTSIGESVRFLGGSSRELVTITKREENAFEVRYDHHPDYLAKLEQDGDLYYLSVARGTFALSGGWDHWEFFYMNF